MKTKAVQIQAIVDPNGLWRGYQMVPISKSFSGLAYVRSHPIQSTIAFLVGFAIGMCVIWKII